MRIASVILRTDMCEFERRPRERNFGSATAKAIDVCVDFEWQFRRGVTRTGLWRCHRDR